MSEGANKRYHHGNLRQSLLEEALKRLQTHGDVDLSLRELAKLTNVSPNAPYRHFKSKDSLLAALAAFGFDELSSRISDIREEGPVKQFRELGQVFAAYSRERGALFRLMFCFRHEVDDSEGGLHGARGRCFQLVAASVQIVMNEAVVNQKVRQGAVTAWSLLSGFSLLAIENTYPLSEFSGEVAGKDVARVLARGLRD